MQLSRARELREQRKKLCVDALELANKANATKEDRANVTKMNDDADLLLTEITQLERAETNAAEFRTNAPPAALIPASTNPEDEAKSLEKRQRTAWHNYMKNGWAYKPTASGHAINGISEEDRSVLVSARRQATDPELMKAINAELRAAGAPEMRDMGSGGQGAYPSATTGFFVPVGFIYDVEQALKFYGSMLKGGQGNPTIFDTATGQVLPYPTSNDTAILGELVGEGQQVTTQDVTLSQILFGAYKYSSRLVKVSIELLQDSVFNLETFLVQQFGIRLGRILNNHFTVGTGTSQPNGIVTAATSGAVAIGSSGNDGTTASTNTIGSDDLINLEHSVDPLYRPGAKYMMHDTTLRSLKQLKDKYGRPLWLPGIAVQAPDTLNSYSYEIDNDMAQLQSVASSPVVVNKTMLFGQLSKYMIRRVRDMSVIRLEERFADYGQVAFLAFARYDGQMLDAGTHPVKYLSNSF